MDMQAYDGLCCMCAHEFEMCKMVAVINIVVLLEIRSALASRLNSLKITKKSRDVSCGWS
jgi:hypothetical protein